VLDDRAVRALASAAVAWSEITREVDEGPEGPHIGAFFDLDRTLVAGFSVFTFLLDGVLSGRVGPTGVGQFLRAALSFQLGQAGFSSFVAETLTLLGGAAEADFEALAERVFAERLASDVFPEARALVHAHQRKGHTLAIVSSATRYQAEPLARDLGIPHVLCTRLEVEGGRFTGRLVRPTCYGEGKLTAARELAGRQGIELAESWFYTDSDEDLALLEGVGRPRPTNPNARLTAIAARREWPTRTFTTRGVPAVMDVVRTSLAVGSFFAAVLVGLPIVALDHGTRRWANVAATTWGELGTALAGIDVQVTGEGHLWSDRPAVFIFNHQSAVDVLLLCKLLRRDFVAISKQEVRQNPIFGPLFALAGTVFIDRFDRHRAIEALRPAIEALRSGLSIAIAPEGTRMPSPRLGRFKKGAFHLAMTAGVPIVPIVFRNALDALPKHGVIVRPAQVEVIVHPPIATAGWRHEDLERHVAEVERLYADTLGL
jgi:putative phosphoserine phosphatase/1-acylglycerol-3-phosphate O-acyltransferase